jgi:galactitol-specific phosphotransferase system IIB component
LSGKEKIVAKPPSAELVQSVIRYFKKEGFKVEHEATTLEGFSGTSAKFDLIVQKGRLAQGVWIRDWNRTIGVNMIINIDKASDDVRLSNPMVVGEKFSDHAKSYANRRKITLLTKRQITQSLR